MSRKVKLIASLLKVPEAIAVDIAKELENADLIEKGYEIMDAQKDAFPQKINDTQALAIGRTFHEALSWNRDAMSDIEFAILQQMQTEGKLKDTTTAYYVKHSSKSAQGELSVDNIPTVYKTKEKALAEMKQSCEILIEACAEALGFLSVDSLYEHYDVETYQSPDESSMVAYIAGTEHEWSIKEVEVEDA